MSNYSYANDDLAMAPGAKDGKLYGIIRLIAMLMITVSVVLVVLEGFTLLHMSTTANGIVFSIGVVGVGGFVTLPWVRVFESFKDKRYKITAIVFLAIVGVCVVLWIVCVWLIIGLVEKGIDGNVEAMLEELLDSLNVIRISIIISLQFIVASYIAKNIIKYNKTLLAYQVVAGVAQLYIDFYACLVLTAITITKNGTVWFSDTAILLTNMWVHAFLFIFIIVAIFPNTVFRRVDRRRLLEARSAAQNDDADAKPADNDKSDDMIADKTDNAPIDEKLRKIKELLDKGLITQEEYDKKREDILNSI